MPRRLKRRYHHHHSAAAGIRRLILRHVDLPSEAARENLAAARIATRSGFRCHLRNRQRSVQSRCRRRGLPDRLDRQRAGHRMHDGQRTTVPATLPASAPLPPDGRPMNRKRKPSGAYSIPCESRAKRGEGGTHNPGVECSSHSAATFLFTQLEWCPGWLDTASGVATLAACPLDRARCRRRNADEVLEADQHLFWFRPSPDALDRSRLHFAQIRACERPKSAQRHARTGLLT